MRKFLSMLLALTATASLAFAATETVNCGGSATLTASPKTGYHFVRWEKEGVGTVSTSATYQVTNIQADAEYIAIFAIDTYTITYNKGANGSGADIANATKTYNVALTLSSSTYSRVGYTQTGWSTTDGGAKAYDLGGSYTANEAANLYPFWTPATVHYTVKHWQQNLANDEYTEVVGDREDKTGTTGANTAAEANSYTGFNAKSFSQNTIAADGSTVINIYYDRQTYTINFYKDSPANAGNKIAGFGGTFKYGATVTAPVAGTDFPVKEATAQYTYTFDAWSPSISYTATADKEYVATWEAHLRSYTITFENWNGTELQSTSVPYGTVPVYEGADPEKAGSTWIGGWSPAVVAVTGEATYTATFDADTYAINVGKEGEGTVTGAGNYGYGATPTITATAASCYTFKGWKKNGVVGYVSTDASYTLPAITGGATYTAVFELNTFTITVTSNDESMGTVTVTKP